MSVVGGALGDAYSGRDVAQSHARVVGDAQQHPGVVGQEAPVRHVRTLPQIISGDLLLVSGCRRSVGAQRLEADLGASLELVAGPPLRDGPRDDHKRNVRPGSVACNGGANGAGTETPTLR